MLVLNTYKLELHHSKNLIIKIKQIKLVSQNRIVNRHRQRDINKQQLFCELLKYSAKPLINSND